MNVSSFSSQPNGRRKADVNTDEQAKIRKALFASAIATAPYSIPLTVKDGSYWLSLPKYKEFSAQTLCALARTECHIHVVDRASAIAVLACNPTVRLQS